MINQRKAGCAERESEHTGHFRGPSISSESSRKSHNDSEAFWQGQAEQGVCQSVGEQGCEGSTPSTFCLLRLQVTVKLGHILWDILPQSLSLPAPGISTRQGGECHPS